MMNSLIYLYYYQVREALNMIERDLFYNFD